MNETLDSYVYDAALEVVHGRNIFRHRTLESLQRAMSLGSHHSVFRSRQEFGTPYVYAFVDTQGNVHRFPGVIAPADQQKILLARKRNGLSEVGGRVRIQEPTGD